MHDLIMDRQCNSSSMALKFILSVMILYTGNNNCNSDNNVNNNLSNNQNNDLMSSKICNNLFRDAWLNCVRSWFYLILPRPWFHSVDCIAHSPYLLGMLRTRVCHHSKMQSNKIQQENMRTLIVWRRCPRNMLDWFILF